MKPLEIPIPGKIYCTTRNQKVKFFLVLNETDVFILVGSGETENKFLKVGYQKNSFLLKPSGMDGYKLWEGQ